MCHQTVRPTGPVQGEAAGEAAGDAAGDAPAERDSGPEGIRTPDDGAPQETQSDDVTPDRIEERQQREEEARGTSEGGACGTEDKDEPAEPRAAQGLRFSSSGDLIGFVNPPSSCSSGGLRCSHVRRSQTSPPHVHNPGEAGDKDSPLPATPDDLSENRVEEQCDSRGAGLEDGATFCLRVPRNGSAGDHDSCDGTLKSCTNLDSSKSNGADEESRGCLT